MKKLALTSLLAVFAVSGAHAANIIDGNPLYRPAAGHFVSETDLTSSTHHTNMWGLAQEFTYGMTDDLAVNFGTAFSTEDWFDKNSWDVANFGLNYRFYDEGAWKADFIGQYAVDPVWGDHASFLDKKDTRYAWMTGVRGGFVGDGYTIAGHLLYAYINSESFNWDEDEASMHALQLGIEGQLVLTDKWNLVAGADYYKQLDHINHREQHGEWTVTLGANYNIDEAKYVGVYLEKEIEHTAERGDWEIKDGYGFGIKFGVDF